MAQKWAKSTVPGHLTPITGKQTALVKAEVPDAKMGFQRMLTILRPYMWPVATQPGALQVKTRVVGALSLLLGAKLVGVQVPIIFKHAVDALAPSAVGMGVVMPVALILGWGAARAGSSIMGELRNAVFARVSQGALRAVALRCFEHLHTLDHASVPCDAACRRGQF